LADKKLFAELFMRSTHYFLLFSFLLVIAWHPRPAGNITVTIDQLRNSKGQVLICLFKDGDGYPDNPAKAIKKGKATIQTEHKATIDFTDIPAGKYAAVVLHDENSNSKMDKTWIGLPKEGYGFSNNVMGAMAPPSFSKASFQHTGDQPTSIIIKLRY
jgi:uncharacterized protein (DUF2141 family)